MNSRPAEGFSLGSAELPDVLPGGSAVAGEAGSNSGHSGQYAPQGKAEGTCPPAKPGFAFGNAESQQAGRRRPMVYTSAQARSACRCLHKAAAEAAAKPPYYLRLTDREFMQVYAAIDNDRSRTHKAIRKGIAEIGDLRASDPLWQILQDVMTRRMKGYRL